MRKRTVIVLCLAAGIIGGLGGPSRTHGQVMDIRCDKNPSPQVQPLSSDVHIGQCNPNDLTQQQIQRAVTNEERSRVDEICKNLCNVRIEDIPSQNDHSACKFSLSNSLLAVDEATCINLGVPPRQYYYQAKAVAVQCTCGDTDIP
jgi:hypothetical protein